MANKDSCMSRITTGVAQGGALGVALGATYGTYDAFRRRIPGHMKIRCVGQASVGFAALFGLCMGARNLIGYRN